MRHGRDVSGQNFYSLDSKLVAVLESLDPGAARRWSPTLAEFGAWVGDDVDREAEYTDRFARPVLDTYDRAGTTVNQVRYNPAWQAVATEAYRRGVVGLNYGPDPAPYLIAFVLDRRGPAAVKSRYLPDLIRRDDKALTGGTWATHLHGGSDVGASTTIARAVGAHTVLSGLKWFVSNVDGGLALATARPPGALAGSHGLGLNLVPFRLEDGSPNALRVRRLKQKLGTCGIATGEVNLLDAWAVEVAPPPNGFRFMMKALKIGR
ncbi:MAG: acyl-CoA dehydrogenase, partial [Alphaproteobacteria bacterium]|nr:acyl-CoA dehydrogenase [Alphaproteobacteria bacterium]